MPDESIGNTRDHRHDPLATNSPPKIDKNVKMCTSVLKIAVGINCYLIAAR